jgi:hypothetical protein
MNTHRKCSHCSEMFAAPSGRRRVFCSGRCREASRRAGVASREQETAPSAGNGDVGDAAAPKRKLTPTERLHLAGTSGRRMIAQGDWTGWLWSRRKKIWQRACDAGNIGDCSRQLGRLASDRGVPDAATCLTRGSPPSWSPAS